MTKTIEPQTRPIVTRDEAIALGLKTYSGSPCRRFGHTERYVNGNGCVACSVMNGGSYRRAHPEQYAFYDKRWREKFPEARRVIDRRWRAANIEADNLAAAEYRRLHPDRVGAAVRKWEKTHPEAVKAMDNNKRARRKSAEGRHTAAEIRDLFVKQKGKCAHPWCQVSIKNGYHEDHIKALALGGSNWISNIQLLCETCNRKKSAKDRFAFARENGRLL